MGNRKTGDLGDRKAAGNQSQAGGGRYDINEIAKEGTKEALTKAQLIKNGKTATGQRADPIELDPEKTGIQGQPR